MKPIWKSFGIFLRQIREDAMLFAVLIAPVLAGCAFRFGVPVLENLLCGELGAQTVLKEYYLLFDLFLAVLTPYMFCFASSMVMLTERDESISAYFAVTPIGRRGYVLSRLVLPALVSAVATVVVLLLFSLTRWNGWNLVLVSLFGGMLCVPATLLIVAFANNRVEGMALAKTAGLILLGLPVPFFLKNAAQYLFSPLPSFWIAKLFLSGNYLFCLPAAASSLLWVWALYRKFSNKIA